MIILRLDRMLAERKISSKELAGRVGISQSICHALRRVRFLPYVFQLLTRYAGHSTANRAMYWNICLTMKPITFLDLKIDRHNLATSA